MRRAQCADAAAIAVVHVDAWRAAYQGLMQQRYLTQLTYADRREMWEQWLSSPNPDLGVFVAELQTVVVGFVSAGRARKETQVGELFSINVAPELWGNGVGKRLLTQAQGWLRSRGFAEAVLWVVPQNQRARGFYAAHGWRDDGAQRTERLLGVDVDEQRYRVAL